MECRRCSGPAPVFTSFQIGAKPLRSCTDLRDAQAAASTTSNLYVILGGALGTAAFIAIILCCVRFFLAENARSRRRRAQQQQQQGQNGQNGGRRGRGREDGSGRPNAASFSLGAPYPNS